MFNEKDNANKVPALLQEIYLKVAGESADMSGIAEYPNDTKVSMLLERIATALEGGGGGGGAVEFIAVYDSPREGTCGFSAEDSVAIDDAWDARKTIYLTFPNVPSNETYGFTAIITAKSAIDVTQEGWEDQIKYDFYVADLTIGKYYYGLNYDATTKQYYTPYSIE